MKEPQTTTGGKTAAGDQRMFTSPPALSVLLSAGADVGDAPDRARKLLEDRAVADEAPDAMAAGRFLDALAILERPQSNRVETSLQSVRTDLAKHAVERHAVGRDDPQLNTLPLRGVPLHRTVKADLV